MILTFEIFSASKQLDSLLLVGAIQSNVPKILRFGKLVQQMVGWAIVFVAEPDFSTTKQLIPFIKTQIVEQSLFTERIQPCVGMTKLNFGSWAWRRCVQLSATKASKLPHILIIAGEHQMIQRSSLHAFICHWKTTTDGKIKLMLLKVHVPNA